MTREEIDEAIKEFRKVLLYEAQLIAFQRKLLYNIKDAKLRNYADAELKKAKAQIIKGQYSPKYLKPAANNAFSLRTSENNKPVKNATVTLQKKPNESTGYNWSSHTYQELADRIDKSIVFLQRFIASKGLDVVLEPNSKIEEGVWEIMKPFVKNKLRMDNSKKKREQIEKAQSNRINKKTSSSPPLRQFVGGNFGKLIYIGKIK